MLKDRFQILLNLTGKSQAEIARDLNIHYSYVSKILKGTQKKIGKKVARNIAEKYGCSYDWIMDGVGDPPKELKPIPGEKESEETAADIVTIQVLTCSAITSYPWEGAPGVVETINVQRDLVDVGGRILVYAVRYGGNSMQPTILNGSLVGIDFEDRKPLENSLFVVRFPGSGPIIKRLRFGVNGYLAVADNPSVPDLVVPQEMFRQEEIILGRVRWIYNKL